jgi:2-oxoglutarate ferredoxin oxidoreductase subunit beta
VVSLKEAIKKAMGTKGFTFVEVLSPCPTQFGRRNRYDAPADMLKTLMETCVPVEEVERLSGEALKDKIVTGEFIHG